MNLKLALITGIIVGQLKGDLWGLWTCFALWGGFWFMDRTNKPKS